MRELEPILFLLSGIVFFGAIEEEREKKNDLKDRVLGEENPVNKVKRKENEVCLNLYCPNFGPLCLGEGAFTLAKGPSPWPRGLNVESREGFASTKGSSPRRT